MGLYVLSRKADGMVSQGLTEILARLRRGMLSKACLDILNVRCLGKLPLHEAAAFTDEHVQVLVTLNADRIQSNLDHVAATTGPVAEIRAEDTG